MDKRLDPTAFVGSEGARKVYTCKVIGTNPFIPIHDASVEGRRANLLNKGVCTEVSQPCIPAQPKRRLQGRG